MRRHRRLVRAALILVAHRPVDPFGSIELAAVGRERAGGRSPGLYPLGPPGAGLLVYDPDRGEPLVPTGRLAPGGLLIECHTADEDGGAVNPDGTRNLPDRTGSPGPVTSAKDRA